MVAISYDSVEKIKAFAEKRGITYPMLSDAGSKTIDAYGIRNKEVKAGSRQDGIPYPGTFILDGKGIVRAKLFLEKYGQRVTNDEVLEAAKQVK